MKPLILIHLAVLSAILLTSPAINTTGQKTAINTDSLMQRIEKAGAAERIDILMQLSDAFKTIQPTQAFEYGQEALQHAQDLKDTLRTGRAYMAIAGVYTVSAMYDKSLDNLLSALQLFEAARDSQEIASCSNSLGVVYMSAGDFANARTYLQQAINLNKKLRNFREISLNYMNQGTNYIRVDSTEKGLSYYLVSLMIVDSLKLQDEKMTLMNRIGYTYARLGQYENALKHFYTVLEMIGTGTDDLTRASVMVNIARGYYSLKNYPAALKYANLAHDLAKEKGFNREYSDACLVLSDIYAAQGRYRLAYEYYTTYKALSDSIINIEKSDQLTKIQTLYELDKAERENTALRLENEKTRKSLRTRTLVILIITLLVVVLAALLYLLNRMNERLAALNRKLEEQGKELELLNDEKDKFFSFVAHNLKNPFNTIMGFAELMQRHSGKKEVEKARQYSGLIYDLSSQVQRVLSNLLEWSRLQRRTFECKPEILELSGLVKDVVEMNNKEAARKDIHIEITGHENVYVSADRAMITTVMQNLLSNAINFTPPSGRITIECLLKGSHAEVSVSDTGIGINKENLKRLFHYDFSQVKIGTSESSGAGLGLIICREMIQKNGGKIFAESEAGVGSRFTFTLPALSSREAELAGLEYEVVTQNDPSDELLRGKMSLSEETASDIRLALMPLFEDVSKVLSIENLEIFARSTIETGEKYGINTLANYGRSLKKLTEAHQIDQIIKILPRFREFLETMGPA
jgi:signal transduction histidine kinase